MRAGGAVADGGGARVSVGASWVGVGVGGMRVSAGVFVSWGGAVGEAVVQVVRETVKSAHSTADRTKNINRRMARLYGLRLPVSTRFDNIGLQHL